MTAHVAMKRPAACLSTTSAAQLASGVKPPNGGSLRVEWSRGQIIAIATRFIDGQKHKVFECFEHGGVEGARVAAMMWLS